MSGAVLAFIALNPEASGVIAAAVCSAIGFLLLSYRWAAEPTSDPHDAPHGDVPNTPKGIR